MGSDDPVLASVRQLVAESLKDMRTSLEGLPLEALNWRPTADANSIAVLATHTMHATRLWLSIAMDAPLPDRDRAAEFRASADSPEALLKMMDDLSQDCMRVLESPTNANWGTMRKTHGRGGDAPPEVSAAYALVHPTEHLRGHVDQMSLLRQLWEARNLQARNTASR